MQLRPSFLYLATLLYAVCVTGEYTPSYTRNKFLTGSLAYTYERIDKNDAVLLVVDLQEGLYLICEKVREKRGIKKDNMGGCGFDLED